jgi:hypothetical protein
MKSRSVRFGLLFLFCANAFAQTLGGNNTWTGTNTYTNYVIAGNGTTGYGFACDNMFLSSLNDSCLQIGASATSGSAPSQALQFTSYVGGTQENGTITQGEDGSFYFQPPNSPVSNQDFPWGVWANAWLVPGSGLEFACQNGTLAFQGGQGDCFYAGALGTGPESNSQNLSFLSVGSATGDWQKASIYEDYLGNLTLAPYTGQTNGGAVRVPPQAFVDLPSCVLQTEGMYAPITDSTTSAWGATISGSGSHHVMGYCDGTNWTVMAK